MARPKTPRGKERLSPAEWEIMRICWELGRANVREIWKKDRKRPKRDYRTILTFVSRMERKGYLKMAKEGNVNTYRAAVGRKTALRREVGRFLTEVVGSEREHLELVRSEVEQRMRRRR